MSSWTASGLTSGWLISRPPSSDSAVSSQPRKASRSTRLGGLHEVRGRVLEGIEVPSRVVDAGTGLGGQLDVEQHGPFDLAQQ